MSTKSKSKTTETPPFKIQVVTIPLVGTSPLSFGKHHETPKLGENESADAYERRTFLEKTHYDHQSGEVFLPPMMLKKSLEEAPKFLNLGTIPGKKGATYDKFFLSANQVTDPIFIGKKITDARHESFFVNPQGQKNASKRVVRWFATFDEWEGIAKVTIFKC
jgi:hypothetical protein